MFTDNDEAGYLQLRVDVSLGMARAAAGDCARLAHQALAVGYGHRLAALGRSPQPRQSPASPETTATRELVCATARGAVIPVEA